MMEYCHVLQLIFMLKKEKKGKGKKEFQLNTIFKYAQSEQREFQKKLKSKGRLDTLFYVFT
jgi:hypothetical protein